MRKWRGLIPLMVLIVIVYIILPHHKNITMQLQAVQYSQNSPSSYKDVNLSITGRYTKRIGHNDRFTGEISIQGYDFLNDKHVNIIVDDDVGCLLQYVQLENGELNSIDFGYIYSSPNFARFVIMVFSPSASKSDSKRWSKANGTIICFPANDLSEAKQISKLFI